MEIKPGKPHTPFNQILLESIDETLTTLGDANKTAMYNSLNAYFYIAKNQIPSKIDTFTKVLRAVFGNASLHLEKIIIKHVENKTGITTPAAAQASSLQDKVRAIRSEYEKTL